MWNQKIQETSEYNKKEADSDIGNKVVITSGEREGGRDNIGVRGLRDTDY